MRKRHSRNRLSLAMLAIGTAVLLVVQGCGSAGGNTGGNAGNTGTPSTGSETGSTAPAGSESGNGGNTTASGKRVLRATFSWPLKIDPAVGTDQAASTALVNLYSSLDYPTASGDMQPYVAKDWHVSDDHLTYTFDLKHGIKFHDGSELTAQDVAFSYDRLMAIGQGFSYLFKGVVESVAAPDDYTVVFKLSHPFGPFLATLPRLYIVNADAVKAHEKSGGAYGDNGDYGMAYLNEHDAGSGPYTIKELDLATHITMQKFPDFFGKRDDASPDLFTMIGTTEASTVRTRMSNGTLEISDQWQTAQAYAALAKISGVKVAKYGDGGQMYLMMNTKKPPTDDVHVRRAIGYLLNYKVITTQIFPGANRAHGPVSAVLAGADTSIPSRTFDIEKAKQELAKSKYAGKLDQYPIKFEWTAEVPSEEQIALMLQANGDKAGLKVDIAKTPWTTVIKDVSKVSTTPNMTSIEVSPDYGEAGSMLDIKYSIDNQGSWQETEWLGNKEIDDMIKDALSTVNTQERLQKYQAIEQKIYDLAPSISPFDTTQNHAYHADYVTWNQLAHPIPVLGYMFDARFIDVQPGH